MNCGGVEAGVGAGGAEGVGQVVLDGGCELGVVGGGDDEEGDVLRDGGGEGLGADLGFGDVEVEEVAFGAVDGLAFTSYLEVVEYRCRDWRRCDWRGERSCWVCMGLCDERKEVWVRSNDVT